jgi:limonene-1,2-epoxide hydrolase
MRLGSFDMGAAMGEQQEQVALAFLREADGIQQNVDGLVAMMSDNFVWQINVPSSNPRIGRDASRAELERQNTLATGLLDGSEIRSVASNDRQVFLERVDVFEMSGKPVTLHITGILELTVHS